MKIITIFCIIFTTLFSDNIIDSFGIDLTHKPKASNINLQERVEGLTSIVEGLSSRIHQLELSNRDNNATISRQQLLFLINEIKKDYVTKDELNILILKSKPKVKLLKEAISLFKKDSFDKSKIIFNSLISRKYKQASCNYYLGEIEYKSKNYLNAIRFFKKSIKLSDTTSFVERLILHSAISLEKTDNRLKAIDFYNNLIENYADTDEAKVAKKRLRGLSK